MSNELTQQEQSDVAFYEEMHVANMHKVGSIWKPIRDEKDVLDGLSVDEQKRYHRGKAFDMLGNCSVNGVPVTADDMRKQLRDEQRY